jgi:hypothetical protein
VPHDLLKSGETLAAVRRRDGVAARDIVTKSDSTSLDDSKTSRMSEFGASLPLRIASSTVSKACANRTNCSNPKMPAPPLTECTDRKTALMMSSEALPSRISVSPTSICCSASLHSSKKVSRN